MVEELASSHDMEVTFTCRQLEVSRSGYYAWRKRPQSQREAENVVLAAQIQLVYDESRKTYGYPRVHEKLKSQGVCCGKNRVAKLMKENDMASVTRKRFNVKTTDSNHDLPIAPREFDIESADAVIAPNQVWVSDLSYTSTRNGFLFLVIFLDVFTRKVVGFSADTHMRTELVLEALDMAIGRQNLGDYPLIVHSDRGSQYASGDFTKRLSIEGIISSMSRRGNCYDNSLAETFFATLKKELIYLTDFEFPEDAKKAIFEYIECWYNRQRLHSSIGYRTPEDYEKFNLSA